MKCITIDKKTSDPLNAEPDPTDIISSGQNADIFVFSGDITYESAEDFINFVTRCKSRENVILVLATFGGDPDAAYRMARFLQDHYKKFSLYVYGFCKSAGTLIALGAKEIVMGDRAEFGPLDVQMHKPDEFMHRVSGLDIPKALASVSNLAWEAFETFFIQVRARSGGVITTKTASEIAAQVVTGLFSPITQNIDPLKLGEMQRSMEIAVEYGTRLGGDEELASYLASTYPTHSFVIDYAEADKLFPCVRLTKPEEMMLAFELGYLFAKNYSEESIQRPSTNGIIAFLKATPAQLTETDKNANLEDIQNSTSNEESISEVGSSSENHNNQSKPVERTGRKPTNRSITTA